MGYPYFLFFFIVCVLAGCRNAQPAAPDPSANSAELVAFMDKEINGLFTKDKNEEARKKLDSLDVLMGEGVDSPALGTFYFYKGFYYFKTEKNDSAKSYFTRAMEQAGPADRLSPPYLKAKLKLAAVLQRLNQPDSAILLSRDVYQVSKDKDAAIFAQSCLNLASVYSDNSDWEMNRKYLFEGFERASGTGLRKIIANNICVYYAETNRPDSALLFFEKNVLTDTITGSIKNKADLLQNYAVLLMKKGDLVNAMSAYRQSLNWYREINAVKEGIYFNMAIASRKLSDFKKADAYLDSAMVIAVREKDAQSILDITKVRAINNYLTGNYKQAYVLLDTTFKLNQRMVDSSFFLKARELEAQYSLKLKDDEIKNLGLANETSERIASQQRYLIIALGAALFLLALLAVVMFRRRQIAMQLKQTELEQRLLRSQMEPHFIFNTLAVLQSQIRSNENEKAIKYLNQFAKLLRVSLENSREGFVDLRDETEALRNYLSLQAMRFEDLFDYTVTVYDGYKEDDVKIPPMLLQPFVENAVHHGMSNIDYKGHIAVTISKQGKILHCTIIDNGNGLKPQKQHDKRSLSIQITRERLAALSKETGAEASINITSAERKAGGTLVELFIPFKQG